jgi:hypothetical protein
MDQSPQPNSNTDEAVLGYPAVAAVAARRFEVRLLVMELLDMELLDVELLDGELLGTVLADAEVVENDDGHHAHVGVEGNGETSEEG